MELCAADIKYPSRPNYRNRQFPMRGMFFRLGKKGRNYKGIATIKHYHYYYRRALPFWRRDRITPNSEIHFQAQ